MAHLKNTVLQLWMNNKNCINDSDLPRSHSRESAYSTVSRILDIQRSERSALMKHAEKLCASQTAYSNAVLERLGFSVQKDPLPLPQPPTLPRRSPQSSLRGRRIRPILEAEECNNVQKAKTNCRLHEDDPFFEKKIRLGSQNALVACKLYKFMPSPEPPISPVNSLSSVDTHTPDELRAISLLRDYTPSPPPTPAPRRLSRLPVMSRQIYGADKRVSDCKLHSAGIQLQGLMEKTEQFNQSLGTPKPPAAARRIPEGKPMAPTPPSTGGLPKTRLPRRGTYLRPLKVESDLHPSMAETKVEPPKAKKNMAPAPPSTGGLPKTRLPCRETYLRPSKVETDLHPPMAETKVQPPKAKKNIHSLKPLKNLRAAKAVKPAPKVDIQPLDNPCAGVSLCFGLLNSEDWEKKLDGFKCVRALARHHPQLLIATKLHELCLVLEQEVANLRSTVACAAIDTVTDLHVYLGKAMDPEVERTGLALLLKLAQTSNEFIHQQTNLALDALVENCSPKRVISTLLCTGVSNHRNIAVRTSIARNLHHLSGIVGEDQTLAMGKAFAERFIIAVSKMSVDPASEVRFYGQMMLQGLAPQAEFMALWSKLVPAKDHRPLAKILKKMKK